MLVPSRRHLSSIQGHFFLFVRRLGREFFLFDLFVDNFLNNFQWNLLEMCLEFSQFNRSFELT
jgi:hypothetical protein